ncbi:MAG: hypothetical protein R3D63_09680 [Paracoccaceae bacterium]
MMRLVNLAHGDLIILGAYLIPTIATVTGLHPLPPWSGGAGDVRGWLALADPPLEPGTG